MNAVNVNAAKHDGNGAKKPDLKKFELPPETIRNDPPSRPPGFGQEPRKEAAKSRPCGFGSDDGQYRHPGGY